MIKTAECYHIPVLLNESIEGLNLHANGVYVDVTFGGGGHSREILSRLGEGCHLYSFDQDADAEQNIDSMGLSDEQVSRFTFVRSNFRYLKNWMRYYEIDHLDGLLADLGVSSHHFDDETRGFSFRFEAPLDMRMNKRAGLTAADILNDYDEERLADLLYLYGELKQSRRIASAIVKAREKKTYKMTNNLLTTIEPFFQRAREKKDMAKMFQALRIEVNHEMDALKEMLTAATELLRPGGRLSVITYHSLEDRMVKNIMKSGNIEGKVKQDFFGRIETPFRLVNNKVITASNDEQERNPRSRSAKLRIAEKKANEEDQTAFTEESINVTEPLVKAETIEDKSEATANSEAAIALTEEEEKRIEEEAEVRNIKAAIEEQAREDEQPQSSNFTLRKILGGDILSARLLRNNIWLIITAVIFTIVYISNRYSVQKYLIEIDKLQKELEDTKYRALSSSSQLTEKTRESHILEILKTRKDSVLKMSDRPPYIIDIPEK